MIQINEITIGMPAKTPGVILDHTEIISQIAVPSYDIKSFAMQLRAAASLRKAYIRSPKPEELLAKFCAKHNFDPEVIEMLMTALGWGGRLEFENEIEQIQKELE